MQGYDAPEHQLLTRSGRWVGEDDWPSPKIEQRPLRLGVGTLGSRAVQGDHSLTVPWRLEAGQASGDTGYFGRVGGLPLDQRPDDELSLVFDSDPLTEPVEILGSAQLELELESDQPWAMLVARLNDVPPTGGVARVSWCVSNLGVDESGGAPDPMTPGKRRRIRLQFANTGYRFESGHRIRLSLSSSYWPLIWPNPKATQITVHLSPESRLTLPVRRPGAETLNVEFPKPLGVQTGETEVLSAPPIRRWTKTDPTTGLRETGWQQPLTRIHHSSIDREHGFTTTAQCRIDPASPVSAEAKFEHELHVRDRDGEVKALCHASLRGSESHFVCRVALQVHENRSIVFEREWDSTIERLCG